MKMENQALVSNVNFLVGKEKIQELELISTIQNLYKEIKELIVIIVEGRIGLVCFNNKCSAKIHLIFEFK